MERKLKLLKDICIEFPPDVKKISLFIRENMDVELMDWEKKEERVSEIIQHAYLMNVCDICELVDEDMSDDEFDEICESCDHEGKQKMLGTDGRYAPKVLKVVLDELGIKGLDTIYSDKCWESIMHSTFDRYTEDVAELLVERNIVPENFGRIIDRLDVRADYVMVFQEDEELYRTYMNNIIAMLQKRMLVCQRTSGSIGLFALEEL